MENFNKCSFIGVDPDGTEKYVHYGDEINFDKYNYALISLKNIYIDMSEKKYPHMFTLTEHSVSNQIWDENIAVIYYTENIYNHDEELAESCLKHPYFMSRNDPTSENYDENTIVRINSFYEDIDPWNAFVTNDIELSPCMVDKIKSYKLSNIIKIQYFQC